VAGKARERQKEGGCSGDKCEMRRGERSDSLASKEGRKITYAFEKSISGCCAWNLASIYASKRSVLKAREEGMAMGKRGKVEEEERTSCFLSSSEVGLPICCKR
jgi:hypothetical protein